MVFPVEPLPPPELLLPEPPEPLPELPELPELVPDIVYAAFPLVNPLSVIVRVLPSAK